ncbi:MAG TPA: hypothetical protein VMD91_17790 [Candidatus Sulfotelmatobacter sp.]|nr:hypothetical protein [Candidatus Sulfotelmatobacter sp.]
MTAPPMRRWQNLLALFAVLLASAALLPLRPGVRLGFVAAAVGVIVAVLVSRLRAHQPSGRRPSGPDVYDRIAKIRAERERRRHH